MSAIKAQASKGASENNPSGNMMRALASVQYTIERKELVRLFAAVGVDINGVETISLGDALSVACEAVKTLNSISSKERKEKRKQIKATLDDARASISDDELEAILRCRDQGIKPDDLRWEETLTGLFANELTFESKMPALFGAYHLEDPAKFLKMFESLEKMLDILQARKELVGIDEANTIAWSALGLARDILELVPIELNKLHPEPHPIKNTVKLLLKRKFPQIQEALRVSWQTYQHTKSETSDTLEALKAALDKRIAEPVFEEALEQLLAEKAAAGKATAEDEEAKPTKSKAVKSKETASKPAKASTKAVKSTKRKVKPEVENV